MNVWVAPIGKLDQAKAVTSETKRPIRGYSWAFTNKHLLYLQDNAGDENFHIFRVDLADGKTTDLTPFPKARASISGLSDSTPKTIDASINDRDPKVFDEYTIELETGTRTLTALNDQGFGGFTLDPQLHPRFATKSLPDGSAEIYVTDAVKKPPADGKLTWKLFDKVPFEDSAGTGVVGVAPGGKAVYMTDSRTSDTGGVVSVDIARRRRRRSRPTRRPRPARRSSSHTPASSRQWRSTISARAGRCSTSRSRRTSMASRSSRPATSASRRGPRTTSCGSPRRRRSRSPRTTGCGIARPTRARSFCPRGPTSRSTRWCR